MKIYLYQVRKASNGYLNRSENEYKLRPLWLLTPVIPALGMRRHEEEESNIILSSISFSGYSSLHVTQP